MQASSGYAMDTAGRFDDIVSELLHNPSPVADYQQYGQGTPFSDAQDKINQAAAQGRRRRG